MLCDGQGVFLVAAERQIFLAANTPYGRATSRAASACESGCRRMRPLAPRRRVAPGQGWIQRCRELSDVPGPARLQVPLEHFLTYTPLSVFSISRRVQPGRRCGRGPGEPGSDPSGMVQ
jgi:hypothetical protein